MPQSLINNNIHFVYSTRERQRFISPNIQPKLWAYVAGIVKNLGGNPIAVGGMDDHIHILAEMPATVDIAKAVNAFKVNSSQWMKDSAPKFAWQRGYAAFSECVECASGEEIRSDATRAPQETRFQSRVHRVVEEAWREIRREVCV